MSYLMLWFFKLTFWPIVLIFYRPKIRMAEKGAKRPKAKGTIIVANHFSQYDVPFIIYAFYFRTVYFVAGEFIYKKPLLGWWVNSIGGLRVNRNQKDVNWIERSEKLLRKGKTVLVFPQSKFSPDNDEPFKENFAVLASRSGARVLSVYLSGNYKMFERAHMIIGKKTDINTLWDEDKSTSDNISDITKHFENYNKELQQVYESRKK